MQVTCPNCGERVTADNINIQKMTAVCHACDTVFSFDLPETQKAKRRKTKRPTNLTLSDNETLQMAFRTNFRLERNETFLTNTIMAVGAGFLGLLLIGVEDVPRIMPLGFLLIAVVLFYTLALTIVNKTHIEMDEDAIKVTRKPIPNPFSQTYEVPLAGVTAIKYEETAASKKEAYDTPRYVVWAEVEGGGRRTVINNVTEDYAVFIAQRLEERLQEDMDLDVSHLEEQGSALDDQSDLREGVRASQNGHQR